MVGRRRACRRAIQNRPGEKNREQEAACRPAGCTRGRGSAGSLLFRAVPLRCLAVGLRLSVWLFRRGDKRRRRQRQGKQVRPGLLLVYGAGAPVCYLSTRS